MRTRSLNSLVAFISAGAAALICLFSMGFSAVLETVVVDSLGFLSLGLAIITGILAGTLDAAEGPSTATLRGLIFGVLGAVVLGLASFALMYFSLKYSFSIEILVTGTTAALALFLGCAAGFVGSNAIAS
jgi:hypothetical protein